MGLVDVNKVFYKFVDETRSVTRSTTSVIFVLVLIMDRGSSKVTSLLSLYCGYTPY